LFRIGLVKSSFIPAKDIRILRELTRYRYKLTSMKSSEKNRFQNAFTVRNVALDSVGSDMFGKSATAITDYLTSDEDFEPQHCVSLLHRSLKKKRIMCWPLLKGTRFRQSRSIASALSATISTTLRNGLSRWTSVSTLWLRSTTGPFRASAAGPVFPPGNNESAGKKKSVRILRAGVYLKPALVQVVHAAVKDKTNPYYALKYERIAKRRGKKRAIIAIARMILTVIYSMLSTEEIWNRVDLFKIDMPEHLKKQQLQKAVKQAVRFLEAQGLTVS